MIIKNQQGNIAVEYILVMIVVISLVFGARINDKTLWQLFQESFQTRHDRYSKTISNLDIVDIKPKDNK